MPFNRVSELFPARASLGGTGENLGTGGGVRTGAVILAALASILLSVLFSVALIGITPALTTGIALFPLYSEEVGIDVYGGVLPIALSIALAIIAKRSKNLAGNSALFRDRFFLVMLGAATVVALGFFGLVQAAAGALVLPRLLSALLVVAGAILGLVYEAGRGRTALAGKVVELYFIGVFGLFLSDLVRTLSGWVRAPGKDVVWGGGGSHDLVVWFGFYMAASNAAYTVLRPRIGSLLVRLYASDRRMALPPAPEDPRDGSV
jgi:hypothetical protein